MRPFTGGWFTGLGYVHGETLAEFIDRSILGRPTGRLWIVWGWTRPVRFFDPSYVWVHSSHLNHFIQSVGGDHPR